ncbi:MAG TPA: RHS repeat-associated core domain-containing protein [Spirochaetota bacterium]|nr:RHS repeat-associated core domain-containing protein [Spirochaetota bacterium]
MSFVRAIPSTAESAKQLIADAMAYLSQVQAEGKAGNVSEFDFRLALDEAVQNAYRHGNGRDPGKRYSPDSHIVAKPKLMTVTGGDGREYRKRAGAYDSLGNLRKISQYLDGGGIAETNIDYYPNGNLMRVTAPVNSRGQRYTENYAYDGAVGVYIEEIRDSHGYASYAKYDYRYGVPVSTADINGQNTLYQYDEFGRLRAVYGPYDIGQGSPTIRVSYHTSSSPAWALVRNKGYWESNDTVNTVTVIDGLKRVIQVKKTAEVMKDGEKQSGMIISGKEVYDALGRVERQGQPVFRPGSENGYTPVSAEKPTVNTYDVVGRKTRIAFPDGTSISNFYGFEENMFLTRTTDQEGKIKKVLKDVQGQIVAVKEGPGEDETNYEYNPMNEIERVIDADLNVTEIDYDNLGRRISINNPDAGLVEYNYDQAGNLIRKITPNLRRDGKYIRYIYYFNHLERIDYPGMANTYYTYGSPGADGNGAGRIVAVDNGVLREKRAYGRLGELVRTDRTIAGTTYTTKYEFDSMGRMRRMVFPDSETLVYAYDRGGLLRHAATHENGIINTYLKDIGYDEFGQRVQVKYGNDAVSTYEYDDTTRRLMHLKTVNKDGTVFQNIEYAYDRVGNILSKKNSNFMTSSGDAKTSEQTYAYDDLHRLTSSNGTFSKESWVPFFTNRTNTYTNTFNYNSIGNILRKEQVNKGRFDDGSEVTIAPTTYTFDYEYSSFRPHAVTKAGTKSFTYDLNGNMLTQVDTASGLNRNIAWDDENRITSTNDSGTVTNYAYDDKGERVIKNGKFGNVVYVNNNFAVRNGTLKSKHIFAGNTRLASKLVDSGTDMGTYYYHADHLGSSNAITTKTGSFHEHIEYFPYGETWVEEKASGGVELGYKFTAKELDAETGLYYFGARYYDAVVSLWTSIDKFLEKYLPSEKADFSIQHDYYFRFAHEKNTQLPGHGGVFNTININLYHYAGNNAIKFIDPDGNYTIIVELPTNRNHAGTLSLYDDKGKLLGTYNALGKGNHSDRFKAYGDTPTGIYKITGRAEHSTSFSQYSTFGPVEIVLEGIRGEAYTAYNQGKKSRSLLEIHGGSPGGRAGIDPKEEGGTLRTTWGCIRVSNEDATDINNKVKGIEQTRGHGSGQDPKVKDTVHVIDTKKGGK